MKYFLHTILVFLFCQSSFAQNTNQHLLDSLNMQLKISRDDSSKVNLYYAIASVEKDYKNFIDNIKKAYDLSVSLNQKDALKRSYDNVNSRLITCRVDTQKVLLYYRL